MKKDNVKRLLSLVLSFALCLSMVTPAMAAELGGKRAVPFELADDAFEAQGLWPSELLTPAEDVDDQPDYKADEQVRVSIVLDGKPAISKAGTVEDLAANNEINAYRAQLQVEQLRMEEKINNVVDQPLEVVWNLTLAANIISANVRYGDIEAIEKVAGVEKVLIETRYEPMVASKGEADPSMATSSAQIGSSIAWAAGYTGAGSKVAIIDTGLDVDHISMDPAAFDYAISLLDKEVDLLTADEVAAVDSDLLNGAPVYLNSKIPVIYNYVDGDTDVTHLNDTQGEHGSHVAGISAANSYVADGEGFVSAMESVVMQGVAPDAQLMIMKVFGKGGGAYDSDYMAAIEDAIVLGADSVNLSLGSGNPGRSTNSTPEYQAILDSLANCGVVVAMSAGNSGHWAESSYNMTGNLYLDDVSMQTNGSPGSFTNSLAVASVDNDGYTGVYMQVGENVVSYSDTASSGYSNAPMTTVAGEQTFVYVDSMGSDAEFAAVADLVKGNIGICNRGTTSFYEKGNAAAAAGAIASIIVNNQPGIINMDLTDYAYTQPCVSVMQTVGPMLKAVATETGKVTVDGAEITYYIGKLTVSEGMGIVDYNSEYYTMSSFSSWGVPGSLQLKPEITAPGGSIYSLNGAHAGEGEHYANDAYELMSGTSMASPQVAGMAAVVAQYIRETGLAEKTGLTARQLAQSLLMSTAVPMLNAENGNYYPVIQQGAGLANVGAAVTAGSYILMDETATSGAADGKVKVELGDDPDREGVYSATFTLNNLTDEAQSFDLSSELFTQDAYLMYANMEAYQTGNMDETALFMDTLTMSLAHTATWTVDGEAFIPDGANFANMDYDGNGTVNEDDADAILEYAIGSRKTLNDQETADWDEDGDIDSHDAYLFLNALSNDTVVILPAGGSVEITVELAIDASELEYLDYYYEKGAYVEGYIYVDGFSTAEGVEGTEHSIPVLGYYGSWADPSMFEVGSYAEYATGDEFRDTYLGNPNANAYTVTYANEPGTQYYFGGNPFGLDATYMPARNAMNVNDMIGKVNFAAIRNAADSALIVYYNGQMVSASVLGAVDSAYYYVNGGTWQNTGYSVDVGFSPAMVHAQEGDTFEMALYLAPEYYVTEDGTDWGSIFAAKGSAFSVPFVVDNTAPVVTGITGSIIHDDDGGTLDVTVEENQYLSAAILYTADGQLVWYTAGDQTEAGEQQSISIPSGELQDGVYLLQVADYALNMSTYRIFLNTEETDVAEQVVLSAEYLSLMKNNSAALSATVLPANVTDNAVVWTTSDETVATVSDDGVVTGVGVGECVITAASVLDENVKAECAVEVITIEQSINGLVWDEQGEVWWSEIDVSDPANYERLTEEGAAAPVWSVVKQNGLMLAQDANKVFYLVDEETFGLTALGSMPYEFPDMAETYNLGGGFLATYGPYVLYVDPFGTGAITPIAQYTNLVTGVTYCGSMLNTYYNQYLDLYYIVDQAGNTYMEAFINMDGDIYYFMGEADGLMTSTPAEAADFVYNSAFYDFETGYTFYSVFNGNTNELYAFDLDYTGNTFYMGDFGDGVWPAAGLIDLYPTEAVDVSDSARVEEFGLLDAEACDTMMDEEIDFAGKPEEKVGGLNAVTTTASNERVPLIKITTTADEIEIPVYAKDVYGDKIDSVNGQMTITYRGSEFKVKDIEMYVEHGVYDESKGEIVMAYADLEGVPAGQKIANIVLERKSDDACRVTVAYEQIDADDVAYEQVFRVESPVEPEGPGLEDEPEQPEEPVSKVPFTDVDEDDSYYEDIVYVYEKGLMNGVSGTAFDVNGTLTRAMVLTTLYRLEGEPAILTAANFTDVADGMWYTNAIAWGAANGIVNGYGNGSFGPNDALTREQLMAILFRYAQFKGMDAMATIELVSAYADAAQVSAYAVSAMNWALDKNLIESTAGALAPKANATRGQVAYALHMFLENVMN